MSKLNAMIPLALVGVLLFGQAAGAAEAVHEAIKSCTQMRNDTERLACYDRAVAHIESGEAAPSKENMFGANTALATPRKPERDADDDLKQMTLTLDNGQIWRQQDADATLVIEIDDSVTISRASLGTFRLTDKRGRSARFRRVR